ncbi:MAG: hypothetical protein KIT73_13960 [Burkholderiales bacterium]|nr:hypothetical protein [Burkholderiales bacterium]
MSISPVAAAAYAKFVQFVEPLTRFDAASVQLVSGTTESVRVVARQTDSVSYEVSYRDGTGKVPGNVHAVGDSGELTGWLDDWRRREQAQLAGRLNGWLAREGNTIGNRLAVQDCFEGSHVGGFASTCETCMGKGKADCGTCKGEGKTECPECNIPLSGSLCLGYHKCLQCHGSGKASYGECKGCFGKGTVQCMTCNLTTPGFVECKACKGKKQVDCKPCDATGWKHRIGNLVCKVEGALAIRAGAEREEPRSTIESLKTITELHALAPLQLQDAALDGNAVRRDFAGAMPVTSLRLRAVRSEFELIAYGEHGDIRDFKNVVGNLLEADVTGLQEALRETSFLPLRPCGPLNEALGNCLRSEVLSQAVTTPPSGQQALVSGPLKNAVSVEFVADVARLARRAVSRSFRAHILLPALIVAVLPTLAFFATMLLGVSRSSRLPIALGVAVVVAVLAELWARLRLRAQFDARQRDAVSRLLKLSRSPWWWRAGMVIGVLLGFIGAHAVLVAAGVEMR